MQHVGGGRLLRLLSEHMKFGLLRNGDEERDGSAAPRVGAGNGDSACTHHTVSDVQSTKSPVWGGHNRRGALPSAPPTTPPSMPPATQAVRHERREWRGREGITDMHHSPCEWLRVTQYLRISS